MSANEPSEMGDDVVAAFRLPIAVSGLEHIADMLDEMYGVDRTADQLRMSQRGNFLVITRNDSSEPAT